MTESKQPISRGPAGFIKSHKKLFIALIAVAVIAVIVVGMIGRANSAFANTSVDAPQTTTLSYVDLEQIVSGTGTIQSSLSREVGSSLSYDIIEIYVAEGDKVTAGQALAQLDTGDIDDDIATAQKNIADAVEQDRLSLAQAERRLDDANNQYSIDKKRLDDDVNTANGQLTSANTDRDSAKTDMDNKKTLLDQAKADLAANQHLGDLLDPLYDPVAYGVFEQTVKDAQTVYDAAVQNHEAKKTAADQKKTTYDTATQQRDTTLRQDSISINNAQDTVDTQKLKDSAANYRTQLEGYLEDKEKCLITAPISGMVTEMTAEVGQSAGGGMGGSGLTGATVATGTAGSSSALFIIEDTGRLEISSGIPEYDKNLVTPGMEVRITSDAIDNAEWRGKVKSVSPKAADENSNFTVVIEIISPDGLAIGMSAKINIITESKENVFAVPYDVVTTNEKGETVVYEYVFDASMDASGNMPQREDMPREGLTSPPNLPDRNAEAGQDPESMRREIRVVTGMETDFYIEISGDGLYEGMVLLADPEGRNVSANTGVGGFMGGGMF